MLGAEAETDTENKWERELLSPLFWWLCVSSCLPYCLPSGNLLSALDCVQPTLLSVQGHVGDG